MTENQLPRWRFYLTALVLLAGVAHVMWEHFHGGVVSHHFLARSDLPAVSNWWGLLLLPALTWFVTGRVQQRIALHRRANAAPSTLPASVVAGFLVSMLLGVMLSVSFMNNYETVSAALFGSMFVLALLLPAYQAQCLLGFVLGMTLTFGAVLPTFIGSVVAAISALMHLLVYPFFVRAWRRVRPA